MAAAGDGKWREMWDKWVFDSRVRVMTGSLCVYTRLRKKIAGHNIVVDVRWLENGLVVYLAYRTCIGQEVFIVPQFDSRKKGTLLPRRLCFSTRFALLSVMIAGSSLAGLPPKRECKYGRGWEHQPLIFLVTLRACKSR